MRFVIAYGCVMAAVIAAGVVLVALRYIPAAGLCLSFAIGAIFGSRMAVGSWDDETIERTRKDP